VEESKRKHILECNNYLKRRYLYLHRHGAGLVVMPPHHRAEQNHPDAVRSQKHVLHPS